MTAWPDIAAWLGTFASRHSEAIGLFCLAGAVSMPELLPWPFSRVEIIVWAWAWLRRTLLTFVSFRGPQQAPHAEVNTDTKSVTDPQGRKVETSSTQAIVSAAPPPDAATKTEEK